MLASASFTVVRSIASSRLLGAWLLVLICAIHILRVREIRRDMLRRLDERLAQQLRNALQFHDSLLQGFQGLSYQLQVVRNKISAEPVEAISRLDEALSCADRQIAAGLEAIHHFRNVPLACNELLEALAQLTREFVHEVPSGRPRCRIVLEGKAVVLDPLVRDEIYGIAREALRNAFQHSHAGIIEAELTYAQNTLTLRVRDNGRGMDPHLLLRRRCRGHAGLSNMRVRAKKLGGQLDVWSEQGAGTEVALTLRSGSAYRPLCRSRLSRPHRQP